jgi:hypothetical protein
MDDLVDMEESKKPMDENATGVVLGNFTPE